jgi:hypothetical protein
MVTFVLRFVTTSPSSKYKTINSRIFYRIVSSYMQIATSFWKVLCHLFIKFKKRTRLFFTTRVLTKCFIYELSFTHTYMITSVNKCGGLGTDS